MSSTLCLITVFTIIILPISITQLVLSQQETSCDYVDPMNLDTRDYLLGLGLTSLLSYGCLVGLTVYNFENKKLLSLLVLLCVFDFCWMIVGGVILFRSNTECIVDSSTIVIFSLVMWCLSALSMSKLCSCQVTISSSEV